ncbi:AraC family transcriptional regulator [Chitinophaga sp. sic0106]|uniref:helix-turn-helix domain-containing protein n=1 Tax=Chitinophaga sp. sic0106 TaxID=2854785 RepID=UPI001C458BD0|nr:helix-turn-helix domain-containing protein [Chitinophaga sp. sic0106]MBV7532101.1 AraC family transcriptional regulator [Chitinophaga sp. sic0106]
MKRFVQFEPIFIRHFTVTQWPFPQHNHNYYELIFFHSGSGTHILNNVRTKYERKALFLLAPPDHHKINIREKTEFSVIRFLPIYLSGADSKEKKNWNLLMDELIVNREQLSEIIHHKRDLKKTEQLIRMMVKEWEDAAEQPNELMVHLLRTILVLLKRHIFRDTPANVQQQESVAMQVMQHIHANIQQPSLLTIEHMADTFHLSASYLRMLFRREVGISVKEYISKYKYQLIAARLKYSQDLLKGISADFGFTDVSHFNKFVKGQSGLNPKDIRSLEKS